MAASTSNSLQSSEMVSRDSPMIAAIVPALLSQALCIRRPRSATILRPVAKSTTPADT